MQPSRRLDAGARLDITATLPSTFYDQGATMHATPLEYRRRHPGDYIPSPKTEQLLVERGG